VGKKLAPHLLFKDFDELQNFPQDAAQPDVLATQLFLQHAICQARDHEVVAMRELIGAGSSAFNRISLLERGLSIIDAPAFIAAHVIAVIAGLWFSDTSGMILLLVIPGLVVGGVIVTSKEIRPTLSHESRKWR